MAECSGDPEHFYILVISWQFEHFWANNWQGIKQFTQNYNIMIQWRKIISFDFHHIPKLSIGFNYRLSQLLKKPFLELKCIRIEKDIIDISKGQQDVCYENLHWASKETYHFFKAPLIKRAKGT